jgi:hypothetical protein
MPVPTSLLLPRATDILDEERQDYGHSSFASKSSTGLRIRLQHCDDKDYLSTFVNEKWAEPAFSPFSQSS